LTRAMIPDPGDPDGPDGPDSAEHPRRDRAGSGPVFAVPSGRLLVLGLAAFAGLLCEGAASDWSAVQLRDSLGASAGVAGSAFVAFSLAMVAGRSVADRVTARLGRVRTIRVFTALGALALAAGLGTGSVAGAICGFGALGAGLSCVIPVLFGAAGRGPGPSGPAIAAVATCGYLGWLLGPAIIGGLARVVGLSAALWTLPLLTAAIGSLAFAVADPAPVPYRSTGGSGQAPETPGARATPV
ncbi:MAG TPA: hypothetical protein VFX70_14915, partial [Mycobacteriales bacterium]|nr:hypothetical protein [Mycobacteriales bacterium]